MVKFYNLLLLLLYSIALLPFAEAGCSCNGGTWDPSAFLNSELGTDSTDSSGSTAKSSGAESADANKASSGSSRSYPNGKILKSMKSVATSDLVIDVSNSNDYSMSHIENAIHIPTRRFIDDEGNLNTVNELAEVLGNAGVSQKDSIVLYGASESSGEEEFAFLVMRYLGHRNLYLLDGNQKEWKAAGLPEETKDRILPKAEYKPSVNAKVIADYEYVKSGQAQIIDARPFSDFGQGRIAGSAAFDPSNVVKGEKIKDKSDLSIVFSKFDKDMPIVVYSDDYSRSSLVWYALQLMGFEARIYTWEDWKEHQSADATQNAIKSNASDAQSRYKKLGTT